MDFCPSSEEFRGLVAVGSWMEEQQKAKLLLLTGIIFVLSDWRPALNLAVLDCADEANTAVCRDFDILGFPTVRVCDKEEGGLGMALAEHRGPVLHFPGTSLGC